MRDVITINDVLAYCQEVCRYSVEDVKTYIVPVSLTLLQLSALESKGAFPSAGLGSVF